MNALHCINSWNNEFHWWITEVISIDTVVMTFASIRVAHCIWISICTVVGIIMEICHLPKVTCNKRYTMIQLEHCFCKCCLGVAISLAFWRWIHENCCFKISVASTTNSSTEWPWIIGEGWLSMLSTKMYNIPFDILMLISSSCIEYCFLISSCKYYI